VQHQKGNKRQEDEESPVVVDDDDHNIMVVVGYIFLGGGSHRVSVCTIMIWIVVNQAVQSIILLVLLHEKDFVFVHLLCRSMLL